MPSVAIAGPPVDSARPRTPGELAEKIADTTGKPCENRDPEDYYPVGINNKKGRDRRRLERDAAKLCDGCPVIAECLAMALATGDQWGIYGGTTPRQRRIIAAGGVL